LKPNGQVEGILNLRWEKLFNDNYIILEKMTAADEYDTKE